jgi:hypothetical protein
MEKSTFIITLPVRCDPEYLLDHKSAQTMGNKYNR